MPMIPDIEKHRGKHRRNHGCGDADIFFFFRRFPILCLYFQLQFFYPCPLFLRCQIHMLRKPVQRFHAVHQLHACTVFSLLHFCNQGAVHLIRLLEADCIDSLFQRNALASFRIFGLNRSECTHNLHFLASELHIICDVSKGDVHVLLEDVVLVQHLTVQAALLKTMNLITYLRFS